MKKCSIWLSLFFGLLTIMFVNQTSLAADDNNKSYSVQAILPDNQLNKDVSYYDLQVTPKKSQTLDLVIFNTGSKPIEVETEINNAYTTDSATIGYDKFSAKTYKSDNPSLSSLVEGKRKKTVTIDANSSKKVSFVVNSPKKDFSGIILGGVTTTAIVNDSKSDKIDVANQIRYVKGVVLHSKPDQVDPNMNLESAAPRAINEAVGLGYSLNNLAPININEVSVKAVISHKGMKDINYSADNLQIAPDSKFNYFIPIKHLKPGIYTTKLTFTSKSGYTKTFNNKLQVSQGKIDALNESSQETTSSKTLIMWIAGLFGVLVVALWVFMYMTGKRIGFKKKDK